MQTKVCPLGKAVCDCESTGLKLKKLKSVNSDIRKFDKYEPPQPRDKSLPPTYNIILSCAVKNGGKTTNIVQLLTAYENGGGFVSSTGESVRQRVIWCAGGTARSKQNNILTTLKSLHDDDRIDLEDNIDERLNEIYDSLLAERDTIEEYNEYRRVYKKFMKSNIANMTDEELQLLEFKSFINPAEDPDAPKDADGNILYHPRMVFLVLDDLISTSAFGNSKNNFFNRLSVKSRHISDKLVGINLIYISQNYKSIPALVRKQTDIFVLLKSANREYIVDNIATELGAYFTKEEILEYYDKVMNIEYGSLILSVHKQEQPGNRIRVGWDKVIERDPKYLNL
jgi:hypothetical protein